MIQIRKIQKELFRRRLPAVLISKPENVRYLCGYIGSNGQLLVAQKQATLITDFRYIRSARKQMPKPVGIYDQRKGAELKKLLGRFKTLGVEKGAITHAHFLGYQKLLKATKLKPISGLVEEFRMIKSNDEMRIIRKAISIACLCFKKLVRSIRLGDKETDLTWRLRVIAHDSGADDFSFSPIIAFGHNTADVHHEPGSRKLKKGDMILIDMGIKYKGYCTDMTRTLFTQPPTKIEQKVYSTVLRANRAAIQAIRVGKKTSDIDRVARGIIEDTGYGSNFGHSLGHGVGLEVHETPAISEKSDVSIKPGMVFTIEPGIYLDKTGGVRIEDMVYVNPKGEAEVLTNGVLKDVKII